MAELVRDWLRAVIENPRRSIHSVKVGLALMITSVLVLNERLFERLGSNAIWAVMTVVVVFELTAGATIGKGSNRAFGTLLAGSLALGVEFLADLAGPNGEPYIVGVSVFIIGTVATYARFCEPFKSKYDYGVMIFLLTFSLIIVSGYRVNDNLGLAVSRFLNIVLGGCVCLVMTMLIKPIWASNDLHKIIRNNFNNLALALEGFLNSYFKDEKYQPSAHLEDDPIYMHYKDVITSKFSEESLANFACWEPRWNGSRKMWMQYVEVGGKLRNCTYPVASLHGCLISNVQTPYPLRKPFSEACKGVAMEAVALLRELGENLERKERSRTKEDLTSVLQQKVESLKRVVDNFGNMPCIPPLFHEKEIVLPIDCDHSMRSIIGGSKSSFDFNEKQPLTKVLAIASVAFLLTELVSRLCQLIDVVKLLEDAAKFRVPNFGASRSRVSSPTATSDPRLDSLTIQNTE